MKVYKSEKARINVYTTYDQLLGLWRVAVKEIDFSTAYGITHVINWGNEGKPPLVLFHGVGDNSALMWIFNAKELAEHFRIFAIDTIGGPGKSCPNENYTKNFDEIKWLDEVFNNLGLDKAYIAGVSNGSFITQHYAIMRPERVIKMISMSGCVSVKENGSPLKTMLKVFFPEALFPTQKNVIRLIKKLAGENSGVFTENATIMEHYTYLLKGFNNMSMSYHKLKYFDEVQLSLIRDKSLFLRGDSDPLGDEARVKGTLDKYNMNYRFLRE